MASRAGIGGTVGRGTAVALLLVTSAAQAQLTGPVKTANGQLQGAPAKQPGVTVFKGIPFAAPPVGNLRWREPQPAANWTGVRPATSWGKVCIQPPGGNRVNPATDMPDSPGMSEDCLFLNVWTPAKTGREKLPVMLWVYGGAYGEGGGSAPFSEGDDLAKKGVVLVTFNYRVGSLGFMAHPELTREAGNKGSGNYALMDQIAALKWIKANIAAFGGDPGNVTIFGESAGAAMNAAIVGSPLAKGLFRRSIAESGGWMGLGIARMVPREAAEKQAVDAATKLGKTSLADLRAMDAQEAYAKLPRTGMIIDGYVFPQELSTVFAEGRQNKVDVLVGSNADEGSFTAAMGPPVTLASWQAGADRRWGSLAAEGAKVYPATTDAEAKAVSVQPFSDGLAWNMRMVADRQAKIGANSWFYHFTHKPPYDPGKPNLLSAHTAEIPYVFDNLAAPRTFPGQSSVALMAGNPKEEAFADQVSSYWVNFARTGDPNGSGLPRWPRLNELAPNEAMLLDASGSAKGVALTQPKYDFFTKMYERDVAGK